MSTRFSSQVSVEQHLYVGNNLNGRVTVEFPKQKKDSVQNKISKITAQFYGICFMDLLRIKPLPEQKYEGNLFYIFKTENYIVAKDVNTSTSIDFSINIPDELPSSYIGKLVKYQYFFVVNFDEKKLKIPIFIHQLHESISNPKIKNWNWRLQNEHNFIPILPDLTQNISHFDVIFDNHSICQLTIEKLSFITGEDIFGCFDFNDSEYHSIKVECDLLSEEVIKEEHLLCKLEDSLKFTNHGHFEENSTNALKIHFQLMIHDHFPSNFTTDLLTLKWFLRFKFFFIEKKYNLLTIEHLENLSEKIKSIKMDLPIHVYHKDSKIQIKEI
eukprot:gene12327-6001_t